MGQYRVNLLLKVVNPGELLTLLIHFSFWSGLQNLTYVIFPGIESFKSFKISNIEAFAYYSL